MIQLALECPTDMLTIVQPHADYYFALTHLVLKDEICCSFYKDRGCGEKTLILDNSTNELLEPCSLEDIRRAADIIKPDLVVAPDFLGDDASTISGLDAAVDVFGGSEILPVVQGRTLTDVVRCSLEIKSRGFDRVAVPYDILSTREYSIDLMASNRAVVVRVLSGMFGWIHLLGFTTLEEVIGYRGNPNIMSMDTGSPVLHGLCGIRFGKDKLLGKSKPTLDLMPKSGNLELVHYNIGYLKGLLASV